jgi:FHA domain
VLFHVTITHDQQDCPGRRADKPPALIGTFDRLEARGGGLGVTCQLFLWGAPCILWAQPEHVAYAVVEAPDLDSVLQYIQRIVPAEWRVQAMPVFSLPAQLQLMRQLLTAPAPLQERGAPPPANAANVTRIFESPKLPGVTSPDAPTADTPTPRRPQSITEMLEGLDASGPEDGVREGRNEAATSPTPTQEEMTTVILGQEERRTPILRLRATSGPSQGSLFEIGGAGGTVGRLPGNLIHLTDGRLSRQHARIDFRNGSFWVTDLASQNGTLINGHLLTDAHCLQPGDTIEVGTSRLTVTSESEFDE